MITGSCLCGALKWTFEGPLESATACNCTACRRYGTLWAYGYEGDEIKTSGRSAAYFRKNKAPTLEFHFCPTCACVSFWRSMTVDDAGKRRIAVNLRLADMPEQVQSLLIAHFDGLDAFEDLPRDGRCIKDMWF